MNNNFITDLTWKETTKKATSRFSHMPIYFISALKVSEHRKPIHAGNVPAQYLT